MSPGPIRRFPPSVPAAFATTVPDGVSPKTLMRLDTNNVAPRLGLAFKLRDRTVLRGGAGWNWGTRVRAARTWPSATIPTHRFQGRGSAASRRPWPQFGGISSQKYDGHSDYHAGHVRVDRRLRNGPSVIGHYSWSKSIDVGGANFIAGDGVYRNPRDIEMDRGLSSFDVRHNMVLSYIWDIPVGRGRRFALGNAWLNGLLGGWQFNGITTARAGTPFTPNLNTNPANAGHARPDRLADGNLPRGERSAARWFDPAGFAPSVPFNYGNAGRNILIGPGFFNTDVGLFRRFAFEGATRRNEIQIRIEAFNEPHYRQPNATVDLLDAGRITGIVGTMREMQVGIKYLF